MLLAADNTWLHFEDRVAYTDAGMLGAYNYYLNGMAVLIMTDQGNNMAYLDLFTYIHLLVFACLMVSMCLNTKTSMYYNYCVI